MAAAEWGENPTCSQQVSRRNRLGVKLFLCLSGGGLYYAGRNDWVRDRKQALDLETIKRATEVANHENLGSMVIVVSAGDPSTDWFIPVPRRHSILMASDTKVPLPKAA
jgi:hypothetical protein